jgi:salicylate biosynthesis isochorismate synthase
VQADVLRDTSLVRKATRRVDELGRPVLVSVSQELTPHDLLLEFERDHSSERLVWLGPGGESMLGLGAAHVIEVHGPDRFAQARRAWARLIADAVIEDVAGIGPMALGGFSFDPRRARTSLWNGFADGRLVIPQRLMLQRGGRAWLTTNGVIGSAPAAVPRLEHWTDTEAELDPDAWQALVADVAGGIKNGQLGIDKVVLARRATTHSNSEFKSADVLRRLASAYPTCTVFGVAHGDATFVGATPERLVALHGGVAVTAALAGSTGRGATPEDDRALGESLLRDTKERAEHEFVVRALRAGLSDVSTRIVADAEPRLKQLPNLQHLWTPMRAEVPSSTSILDLVERLHPTPAMGGFPTQPALDLIRTRERLDRGWYAGPIGWLNAAGEGEFVVGIRSALLRGREASLFAGCGIVADSEPAAEYAELGWKLRPMLAALGVEDR